MRELDVRRRVAPEQDHGRHPRPDRGLDLGPHELTVFLRGRPADLVDDHVDPEGAPGQLARALDALLDALRRCPADAQDTEATSFGDRRHQFGTGDRSHACGEDRHLDSQRVTERRPEPHHQRRLSQRPGDSSGAR